VDHATRLKQGPEEAEALDVVHMEVRKEDMDRTVVAR